jgi:hypothetical protein
VVFFLRFPHPNPVLLLFPISVSRLTDLILIGYLTCIIFSGQSTHNALVISCPSAPFYFLQLRLKYLTQRHIYEYPELMFLSRSVRNQVLHLYKCQTANLLSYFNYINTLKHTGNYVFHLLSIRNS